MAAAVVFDDVGAILRLGLRTVLAATGIALVADPATADAILINLDAVDAFTRADALARAYPGVVVIACSADRPVMRVLSGARDSGECALTSAALSAAVGQAATKH